MSRETELARATRNMRGFFEPVRAYQYLTVLPRDEMQLHLLAEELDQDRPQILGMFPKVGPQFRARFIKEAPSQRVVKDPAPTGPSGRPVRSKPRRRPDGQAPRATDGDPEPGLD